MFYNQIVALHLYTGHNSHAIKIQVQEKVEFIFGKNVNKSKRNTVSGSTGN